MGGRASPNWVHRAFISPYNSPIVMAKKKTRKWRLCVDFTQINAKSVKDSYPMSRINYILDQLREVQL